MTIFSKKPETVMGWTIAPPRLGLWAYLYGILYFAVPFLGAMALLDLVFYFIFQEFFDSCYAVFCLFEGTDAVSVPSSVT
ncbi:hypothetical protein GCM10017044_02880 [Kordiimonas sediminis]|uniref:Uncharacterized protein n=1 Tax=Kordiimonas sediminis TaxID=1735581 RepID=A0A919E492_9PROT|nr:hypothetical protein [Kordiimonas sediminis]GHF12360.1 hypothetical protein GCM10017044_02880 [Kordiimonas sediminis]